MNLIKHNRNFFQTIENPDEVGRFYFGMGTFFGRLHWRYMCPKRMIQIFEYLLKKCTDGLVIRKIKETLTYLNNKIK